MTTLAPGSPGSDAGARVNIAPMGPIVDPDITRLIFRPFKTSTTYRNLKATGQGVFHVTDDALLLARAAVGKLTPGPGVPVRPAEKVEGLVLTGACRYYELRVTRLDDREERTTIEAEAIHTGRLRDFIGFNRARHAVVEAAILATRVHLTSVVPVLEEFKRLQVIVDKTGADTEQQAMTELRRAVESRAGAAE
jgi:hypothetical protein